MQVVKEYEIAIVCQPAMVRAGLEAMVNKLAAFKVGKAVPFYSGNQLQQAAAAIWHIDTLGESQQSRLQDFMANNHQLPVMALGNNLSLPDQVMLYRFGIKAILTSNVSLAEVRCALTCLVHCGAYYPDKLHKLSKELVTYSHYGYLLTRALSARQKEILLLLAADCTAGEIATKINRSIRTVEWHVRQMKKLLGVRSTRQLLLLALNLGLIELPMPHPGIPAAARG